MTHLLTVLAVAGFGVLAARQSPIWQWAAWALASGLASRLSDGGLAGGAGLWLSLVPAVLLVSLAVPFVRRTVVTGPILGAVRKVLPQVSRTEQDALDAGTVGWDAELFSGRPDWRKLLEVRKPELSAGEQAFIDGPVNELCAMIDDWDTRHNRADMPAEIWQFLKDKGFLGMLISKPYGGLGFSAQAQSQVVAKIASRSVAAAISVMVPNSLGPGELLEKYGTDAQKAQYLERLARGREVPCFALTAPHAGSDAAGMRDVGVVTYGTYKGKEVLGVLLNWDKRYITLAPVATLIGLAIRLHDPDNHLGKGEDVGITICLVPAGHPGVETGARHWPSRSAFMNGPTRGRDVFVPLDFVIGGPELAGQGWRMLMESLATGRAISLPAIGTMSIKQALRVTSAYGRIRRQFNIPVGLMEGVAAPMARLVKSAYMFEAARAVTAAMVDGGERPSVISALLKYQTTEAMRDRINDAMDIHGGRAIQDGPSNYLFSGYAVTPVAISVEGANILTRSLITFAQGALRAHPHLYAEVKAAQDPDKEAGLVAFDRAFCGHAGFMVRNIVATFWHAISLGRFASSPVDHQLAGVYRRLHRYAQAFALVGDWTVVLLGGDLKRKQVLSGRMADILSDLYLLSAALKRFEDDGHIAEDVALIEAIAGDRFAAIEANFCGVFDNFPNRVLGPLMRFLVLPLGRRARAASDRLNFRLARAVLVPGAFRDRLTRGAYTSFDPGDITGRLEDGLIKVIETEEIEKRFIKALRKGVIARRLDRDVIKDAVSAGVISASEAGLLRAADEAADRVIAVDEFAPGVLENLG